VRTLSRASQSATKSTVDTPPTATTLSGGVKTGHARRVALAFDPAHQVSSTLIAIAKSTYGGLGIRMYAPEISRCAVTIFGQFIYR
jgi:hypothetical protein